MSRVRTAVLVVFSLFFFPYRSSGQDTISQRDRVLTGTKIYQQITTFYPDLAGKQFDQDYSLYVEQILDSPSDRQKFDLASMALVATLHDAHTWFYDRWLDKEYGQPVGFAAYPLHGRWTVMHTSISSLRVGDVIEAIDDTDTQQFFERSRKYISASSDRDAGVSFFDTPVLFPERFTLKLDGGRKVVIDRAHDKKEEPPMKTEGKLVGNGTVAYIRVPVFRGIETQAQAMDYLRQFHEARAVILDVRGNPGLGDGGPLQRTLMGKPYPAWTENSSVKGGLLLRHFGARPESAHVITGDVTIDAQEGAYSGRLILLIDRGCTCACEDFVMPFKFAKRAQLVGETTFGSYSSTSFTQFDNGMILNVAAVRHIFPDGSRFEGVGISPDVEIEPSIPDLKLGRDVVLERAIALAMEK